MEAQNVIVRRYTFSNARIFLLIELTDKAYCIFHTSSVVLYFMCINNA